MRDLFSGVITETRGRKDWILMKGQKTTNLTIGFISLSALIGCVSGSQETYDNRVELAWDFIQNAEILQNPVYPGEYVINKSFNDLEFVIDEIEIEGSNKYIKEAQYARVTVSNAAMKANQQEELFHFSEIQRDIFSQDDLYTVRYREEYENNGKEFYWPDGLIVIDFENQYRLDDGIEYIQTTGGRYLKKKSDEFKSYIFEDRYDNSDAVNRLFGIGNVSLVLYPPKDGRSLQVGDQWEREFFSHMTAFSNYLPNWMEGTQENGELHLCTYILAGFTEIDGRACAIVEYLIENYRMAITQEMDEDEFKKAVIGLSKSSMKDVKEYLESDRSGDRQYGFSLFFPTGYSNTAQQESSKTLGILAFDIENQTIINASAIQESQWIRATDVSSLGVINFTYSDMDVYRANISYQLQ